MKVNALITLAAICASHVALAADTPSTTINQLVEATKTMDKCAALANQTAAIKAPPEIAASHFAASFNLVVTQAHAKTLLGAAPGAVAKPVDPTLLKPISAPHQALLGEIQASSITLGQCADEFAKIRAKTHDLAQRTSDSLDPFVKNPQKQPTGDDKKVVAALGAYVQSQQALGTALVTLANHPVLAPLVSGATQKFVAAISN